MKSTGKEEITNRMQICERQQDGSQRNIEPLDEISEGLAGTPRLSIYVMEPRETFMNTPQQNFSCD
jgi:hypothetical protein